MFDHTADVQEGHSRLVKVEDAVQKGLILKLMNHLLQDRHALEGRSLSVLGHSSSLIVKGTIIPMQRSGTCRSARGRPRVRLGTTGLRTHTLKSFRQPKQTFLRTATRSYALRYHPNLWSPPQSLSNAFSRSCPTRTWSGQ